MPRLYNIHHTPEQNLEILAENYYPGRFLAVGFCPNGDAAQLYAIGGRSEGSKNRVLVEEDNIVSTEVFDPNKSVGDPTLTIYDAMRRYRDVHVVSNGDQTSTAIQYMRCGKTFFEAMESRDYEPDSPNYTPRISGFIDMHSNEESKPVMGISVIRKVAVSDLAIRNTFSETAESPEEKLQLENGLGYAVHTYLGDGKPLPSYDEAPFTIPIQRDAKENAEMLWENLNPETRVAVVAKTISAATLESEFHIINLHKR